MATANYDVKVGNSTYNLTIKEELQSLTITVIENETFPSIVFASSFTLQELISKNRFFRIFENITEVFKDITNIIEKNNYSLFIESDRVVLKLTTPTKTTDEIILAIPRKKIDPNQILQENTIIIAKLRKDNTTLQTQVHSLQNEVKQLKDEIHLIKSEMNSLKEALATDPNYLSRRALASEKIILDDIELHVIKKWIALNKKVTLSLIYKASRDGDDVSKFHELCDGKKPTLTVFKTIKGFRAGGFTNASWDSSSGHKVDNTAFVFSLDRRVMYRVNNSNCAIYCHKTSGPSFGGGNGGCDLFIANEFTKSNDNYSNTPHSYKATIQHELTGLERNFTIKDLEVYLVSIK